MEFEVDKLFVEFLFNAAMCAVGDIGQHPSGIVSPFVFAFECVLCMINTDRIIILAAASILSNLMKK